MTYQRITEQKNVLSLKSGKIFPVHQDLIEKKGIGMLHSDAETLGVPEENVVAITNGGGIRAWIHKGDG